MIMENPGLDDDSDSDSEGGGGAGRLSKGPVIGGQHAQLSQGQDGAPTGLKPGKKTKGRVKIKMEFIENKLRRYTTFSKRKTGIMKKAYELSTLTGTQVMLLVASETGHVYTFATRKLQPMITSESGKALIQTCLNSPEQPNVPGTQQAIDQRMNPTGFEETELSYAVNEEETKAGELQGIKHGIYTAIPGQMISTGGGEHQLMQAQTITPTATQLQTAQPVSVQITGGQSYTSTQPYMSSASSYTLSNASTVSTSTASSKSGNMSMQLPTGGITAIIQQGAPITIPVQQNTSQISQPQQQTLYRIPTPNQVVSLQGGALQQNTVTTDTGQSLSNLGTSISSNVNILQGGTGVPTTNSNPAMTPGIVMYQTPQGVVYATPTTATLPDGSIFNFQQPATALSLAQPEQQAGSQQYITIPVPVSLAGSPQVLQISQTGDATTTIGELSQPSVAKKSRK
ncbi:serum response factor-like isoform X2 [Liolophura sinensis]|uniref:serum response factor-like isoform X2 n=1 Tax=Liolophura sinensis TaxID=3198878 RepID=UPI003158CF32